MPEERLWCTACGTVTRDQTCDCNRWHNEMSREPHFVNYADAMQEAAHEQAQAVDKLEAKVVKLRNLIVSKTAQLRNYAANDCQLDHARTIAQGRIEQALQVQRWLDDLFPDAVGGASDPT